MIDGHVVLEGGRLLTVDEAKVRSDAERAVARLKESNAQNMAFARCLEVRGGLQYRPRQAAF